MKKIIVLKYLVLVLAIVVSFSGPLLAQEGSVPEEQAVSSGETSEEPTGQQSSDEAAVWPPPFKPSEEIGADSQISFPTDI